MQLVFRTDRLVLEGKFLSWFDEKQTRYRYLLHKIYENKLRKKNLNVLNDNFKQKTKGVDAKTHDVTGKNKQVNLSS